jgi:tripartite-type tricarboxylate transporter receptor subunit TctC
MIDIDTHRLLRCCAAFAALAVVHAGSPVQAQDYPSRPVRVIATSSAGGTSDIFMRALADELHKRLGQPFLVENRPGGAFNIGARACSEAPPDGYTLCIIPGEPLVFNQFLFKNLGFDPENGFEPVTQLFFITQALVVSGALNVKTLPELIALSKAKPGTLSYSTAAVPLGVFIERLKQETGADLVRVPFRGGGEAMTAMLNGSVPVGFYGIANMRAQLESGAISGLLVDGEQRSPLFPAIPSIVEATGKSVARSYFGLLAPAKTPKAIVARLQAETARIVAEPAFRERNLTERGLEPIANTSDEFARYIRNDRIVSEQLVKESGLQPQ